MTEGAGIIGCEDTIKLGIAVRLMLVAACVVSTSAMENGVTEVRTWVANVASCDDVIEAVVTVRLVLAPACAVVKSCLTVGSDDSTSSPL